MDSQAIGVTIESQSHQSQHQPLDIEQQPPFAMRAHRDNTSTRLLSCLLVTLEYDLSEPREVNKTDMCAV